MNTRATYTTSCAILLSIFGILTWGTTTWASTRVGDAELQLWYRDRNTFHTDGGKHFDWVQWRNEVFAWLVYDNLVKDGLLLGKVDVPWVKSAAFNVRYRFRADPYYAISNRMKNHYDRHTRESFIFPENGFRDLFLDMDFGEVGPGRLSVRAGNQQIVWGESDLFRSIDVINPLRIDQNQGAGEKFDEFRSPIWALKALYNVGNVGSWFSNVSIEPFWSPRYRDPSSDLLLDEVFRIPFHEKGCLDDNNNLVAYSPSNCSFTRKDGSRVFVPYNPGYIGNRRQRHPWGLFGRMGNPRDGTGDYTFCVHQDCSPDIANERSGFIANISKGEWKGPLNGAFGKAQAGGVRVIGTSIWGVDWSLNYAFIPVGLRGFYDINKILLPPSQGGGIRPDVVYGGGTPGQTFEEGLRRCLSEDGKTGKSNAKNQGPRVATLLIGADLTGYNNPARFRKNNPRGALDDNGEPLPGFHNAVRAPQTFCAPGIFSHAWSHIAGFTGTYNDFDYTGMVFRVEESLSTKEFVRHLPGGFGPSGGRMNGVPLNNFVFSQNVTNFTRVWRSMVGFDLLRSYQFFKYIPFLHHSFYDQAWFLSGQWLMQNQMDHVANPLCYIVDNGGNGITKQQAAALRAADGKPHYSNPQCRRYHWNHLFTLGFANQGLFASRVETRNAVVLEPRSQDWILFSQWWWRNVMGYENIELSAGVAWYPSSAISQGWSGIQHFADRDQLWLEFTYYIL
jgi:Protein of unknown function (DUF1302)